VCISQQLKSSDDHTVTPNSPSVDHLMQCLQRLVAVHLRKVIVELLKTKCLLSLLYDTEACPVNRLVLRSLEFVINNAFRKIFSTKSDDIVNECVLIYNCSVSHIVYKRKATF